MQNFGGRNVWLNPPFSVLAEVVQHFIWCKTAQPVGTSLTMVIPAWPEQKWFQTIMSHPRVFRVVGRYPRGSCLFTCPIPEQHGGGRRDVGPTQWPILVLRVDASAPSWGASSSSEGSSLENTNNYWDRLQRTLAHGEQQTVVR